MQSQDQTPSPRYVNGPSNQNGDHMQPGRVGQATPSTPQVPSSLALGYSQRSHTGETPLLAPTPDPDQPFSNVASTHVTTHPSYSGVVGAGYSEQDRSQVYATVGVGSQRGCDTSPGEVGGASGDAVPIYSNTTIAELANNVQLQGADVANQTVV